MGSCWISYDDEWITDNYPGRCTQDFYLAYCERTGFTSDKETLRKHIRKLDLQNRAPWKAYTKEMDDWLIENYPKMGRIASITRFKEIFGVDYTLDSIGGHVREKLGIYVDRNVAYQNRYDLHSGIEKKLYAEGEIRTDADGYKQLKVNNKWIPYRRYLWEKANGKIPKGYSVTYLDSPDDYSMENTVCVPRKYITLLTSHKLRAENKTITKCGIKWCELYYVLVEQGLITPRKDSTKKKGRRKRKEENLDET